jgi:NAD(P)-dependent dehydrogenase (short-subunit alcohol dehydrogenase family)
MSEFLDRVALITGAGSGIGRQLARLLSAEGARIAALDVRPEGLTELATELTGKPVVTATADVTDLAAMRAAVAELEARLGPTDLLIACAGIGRKTCASPLVAEEINAHIQVNLVGVVNSIDSVLAGMQQRRRGHLVALSSLASYRGLPLMAGYCASKAGVNALFDALRVELRDSGIAVTTVCPGWVRTPMTAPLRLPRRELMEVAQAAEVILEAIRRRAPFVAFPPRLVWQLRMLRYLPRPIGDWLAYKQMARARRLLPGG